MATPKKSVMNGMVWSFQKFFANRGAKKNLLTVFKSIRILLLRGLKGYYVHFFFFEELST